jgi:pimeloyl-ACP methyl ester carboxylesterase
MRFFLKALALAVVLALVAGIGFWLRPVSYFNEWMYLQEDFGGVESRNVQVEGFRVHYLDEGPPSGPVVVLVHGLGGRAEDWRYLAPFLARAGFRVYMPDLLGYGRSQQPANFSYSVRDEAAVVVGFLDAMGLKQVQLGGWSMGGWVAQLIAAGHPERVSRLMLFDSAGLDVKPIWNAALFTPDSPAQLDQLDALLMPVPPHVPPFLARDIVRISRRDGWIIQRALASMYTEQDVTDTLLPKLKMPVLLVWGALDQVIPIGQAQTMHRLIPQSQLEVFPGCGHLAPMQCAGAIGPKVVAFASE